MNRAVVISVLVLMTITGCKSRSAPNTFHVTAVNPDSMPDVVGTFEKNEYALSVSREGVPLYVAYYEPIGLDDVGKDFQAVLANGSISINVPGKGWVRYDIQRARER